MIPESATALIAQLRSTAKEEKYSSGERREITAAVRRAMGSRPKKKSNWRDDAYADYKKGARGLQLYRKHIPGFTKFGRWRRKREGERLSKALSKRAERERKRQNDGGNKTDGQDDVG